VSEAKSKLSQATQKETVVRTKLEESKSKKAKIEEMMMTTTSTEEKTRVNMEYTTIQ